ncbi:unnamed protein product, partial [Heterosigma akashiwo]
RLQARCTASCSHTFGRGQYRLLLILKPCAVNIMANIYPSERETARLIAQPHNRSSFRSSKWMLAFTLISVAT